jgi:ABC-type Zn2+ transport system substrate-binding protein/surface adhesin
MNGVESEVGKVLQQAERKREVSSSGVQKVPEMEERAVKQEDVEDEEADDDDEESEEQSSGVDTTPAGSTRSKARQRRKA